MISDGVGTDDGPFRKSDFCDSDSLVDVKLIAIWIFNSRSIEYKNYLIARDYKPSIVNKHWGCFDFI